VVDDTRAAEPFDARGECANGDFVPFHRDGDVADGLLSVMAEVRGGAEDVRHDGRVRGDALCDEVGCCLRMTHLVGGDEPEEHTELSFLCLLAEAAIRWYESGDEGLLDAYSEACLRRVWRCEHFSWWLTTMLHLAPDGDPFDLRLQRAQLRYVATSEAQARALAENYVGLETV